MQKLNNNFYHKDFISVEQFSHKRELDKIFTLADQMKEKIEKRRIIKDLKTFCLVELFYQPSTRTYTSFLAAGLHLGAKVIPIHGMQAYSSAVKGESLPDTVRTVEQTTAADLLILRHPADDASEIAAKYASIPIINAGSGTKEHPTQAVLDLYTLIQHFSNLQGLNITFVGDMKYGRTVKSLAKLLTYYAKNLTMNFVAPKVLKLPNLESQWLKNKQVKIHQTENLEECLSSTDVLYVTRVQKEWFEQKGKLRLYQQLKNSFIINQRILQKSKKKMIIMHPLPRVGEIAEEIDNDPRAVYFSQMRNGLYTRMALLRLILLDR